MSFDLSAGLDLTEFYQKDRSHVSEFWKTVQDMWHTFYTTGLPVASCISGHCPAGGLIIASCSDYRVMQRGKFTIGLNEVRKGWLSTIIQGYKGGKKDGAYRVIQGSWKNSPPWYLTNQWTDPKTILGGNST